MEVKMEEQVRADENEEMKQQPQQRRQRQQQQQQQQQQHQQQPPQISEMKPVTEGAYGGGLYGTEKGMKPGEEVKGSGSGDQREHRSETQSADGPVEHNSSSTLEPKHKPPPSSGDRDIDITGQSYIQ